MNFTQAMNDLISDIDKYGCQNGGYNYTDDTKGVIPRVVYMKKKTWEDFEQVFAPGNIYS